MHATETDGTVQPEVPYWGRYAQRISDNGYRIVPTVGKRALVPNWPSYQFAPIDADRYRHHNVGILTALTPALDVDCLDPVEAEFIAGFILRTLPQAEQSMVRVGQSPKFALLFRTERPFKKMAIRLERAGARLVVEWLGNGQQLVAIGRHPAGHEYQWTSSRTPLNTPASDLPEVTEQGAHALLFALQMALQERGWKPDTGAPAPNYEAAGEAIAAARDLPPMPPIDGMPEPVREALERLDPTPREQWISVGHHLKAIIRDWSYEAWVAWSRRAPSYQPGDEDRWDTFRPVASSGQHALLLMAGMVGETVPAFEPEPGWVPPQPAPEAGGRRMWIEWPQDAQPKPIQWLVKGILERDAVGVIWGEPGTYKSFVALSLVLSVVYKRPWLGHGVVLDGDALIIAGEGAAGLHRRIEAWKRANEITEPLGARVGISRGAIVLNDEFKKNVTTLIAEVLATGKKPRVMLIDTVARNMTGDENSQQDMGRLVECIDLLRHAFPGCTIILVHHANKQGGIRGSTVLVGAADFEYVCEKKAPLKVEFTCNKMKDAEMPPPVRLDGRVIEMGVTEDGDPINSLAFEAGMMVEQVKEVEQMDDLVMQAVRDLVGEGKAATGNAIAGRVTRRKGDVLEAIEGLVARGQLVHISPAKGYRLAVEVVPEVVPEADLGFLE